MSRPPTYLRPQAGSIMILASGLALVLIGFALLAFDACRIFIVRTELQNAADSAALAGASCLARLPLAGSTIECSVDRNSVVNWNTAQTKALDQLGKNAADKLAISTTDAGHAIEVGYWNLLHNTVSGSALSTATGALEAYDTPGVKVSVTKDTGMNGGLIHMLSAALSGGAHVAMTASAVAVLASPARVAANSLAPYVINQCLAEDYWDFTVGEPRLATSSALNGVPQTIDQPWEFRLGPDYSYTGCTSGQWTSFGQTAPGAEAIRNLIANGNPETVAVGDEAWIEPGVDAALYEELAQRVLDTDLPLLIIATANSNQSAWAPVVGVAGFHVTEVSIDGKYIQGHFIKNYILAGSSGVGPYYYGVYTPPRLAR